MHQKQIVTDILDEARGKADAMRADSRRSLDARKHALEERERKIAADAEERIDEQRREITARYERSAQRARDRIRFDVQKRAIDEVERRVRDRIAAMRDGEPEAYHHMLLHWTAEAILGVGTEEAITLWVAGEDRSFLVDRSGEVRALVTRHCDGTPPEFAVADTPLPAGAIGVVARDASGRRGFSNTLEDRLRRYDRDIHSLIMETLFVGSEEWASG